MISQRDGWLLRCRFLGCLRVGKALFPAFFPKIDAHGGQGGFLHSRLGVGALRISASRGESASLAHSLAGLGWAGRGRGVAWRVTAPPFPLFLLSFNSRVLALPLVRPRRSALWHLSTIIPFPSPCLCPRPPILRHQQSSQGPDPEYRLTRFIYLHLSHQFVASYDATYDTLASGWRHRVLATHPTLAPSTCPSLHLPHPMASPPTRSTGSRSLPSSTSLPSLSSL